MRKLSARCHPSALKMPKNPIPSDPYLKVLVRPFCSSAKKYRKKHLKTLLKKKKWQNFFIALNFCIKSKTDKDMEAYVTFEEIENFVKNNPDLCQGLKENEYANCPQLPDIIQDALKSLGFWVRNNNEIFWVTKE